jgi:transposase
MQELPRAHECLSASVAALQAQLAQIDRQIEAAVKTSRLAPLVRRLRAVPGVGPVSSSAFGSRLDSRNFDRSDQWVAYCGMDVSIRQSGKHKGERGLTKQGDAELRRLAYLCAQAAVRQKGSPFTAQFERERAKGLTKTAAYCAVARKLLTVLWAIQHRGVEYDPEMVYLPPWERRKREQPPAEK